jgi:uncharacterized membrane protein
MPAMKSLRYSALFLGLAWALFLASLAYAAAQLPEPVASHFGVSGQANGWMSRSAYLMFMAAVGFGLPLFITALSVTTRFVPDALVNLPHKDYWLAPERRAATFGYLGRHSLWLAAMMVVFLTGLNLLTVLANRPPSPHLSNTLVWALAGAFLAGTALWAVALYRHFQAPTPQTA